MVRGRRYPAKPGTDATNQHRRDQWNEDNGDTGEVGGDNGAVRNGNGVHFDSQHKVEGVHNADNVCQTDIKANGSGREGRRQKSGSSQRPERGKEGKPGRDTSQKQEKDLPTKKEEKKPESRSQNYLRMIYFFQVLPFYILQFCSGMSLGE